MPTTTDPFTTLRRHDVLWCVQRLPREVRRAMKKRGASVVLAGGYLRSCIANEKIADVDLFTPSPELSLELAKELADTGRVYTTDNAHTVKLSLPCQVIHRWTFAQPEDVVPSFDFTVARAAIWFEQTGSTGEGKDLRYSGQWKSCADPEYYSDLAGKRLVYRKPIRNEDAGGSMLRVLKFYQRGYRMPLDSLGEVIARLMGGVAESGLAERDLAKVLCGLLREVDPMVDPDGIAHLPSSEAAEENEEDVSGALQTGGSSSATPVVPKLPT